MRFILPFLILFLITFIVEFYAFQAIKTLTKNKIFKRTWLFLGVLTVVNFVFVLSTTPRSAGQTIQFQWAFGFLLLNLIPKILTLITLLIEDLFRGTRKTLSILSRKETQPIAGRRKFISQLALGLAAIPFSGFLYGIIKGRYNYKVLKYELSFKDLPEAFNGFTITQISDLHAGSFTNQEKIQYGVQMINDQQSDLLLFTGDIVNTHAHEMNDWIPMFAKLEAPFGKYSILGNHDYGEYSEWNSPEDKEANFQAIKDLHPKIGFDLLLNESRTIEKDGQKIALIGVENWGKNFKQAGDLKKASKNIAKEDFKIIMTHDPSHWDAEIKDNDLNYNLTLSGHTHGLQFGIEIPGWIKWSPSQYVYKQWAGMYNELGKYINVNRGFGYHALPGRVGIWPEVTVITLKKDNSLKIS